jgi:hypothetical protein
VASLAYYGNPLCNNDVACSLCNIIAATLCRRNDWNLHRRTDGRTVRPSSMVEFIVALFVAIPS